LTMKDWPEIEKAYEKIFSEIEIALKERAEKETKLRSIPVERGGRYLIIAEPRRPIPIHEWERLDSTMKDLNIWLTDEDTPFKMLVVVDTEIRFERVKAATDERKAEAAS